MSEEIRARLQAMQDIPYRDFQRRLIPGIDPRRILGVRTPQLRALAGELAGTRAAEDFLRDLPHGTFEENQLHAFLIGRIRDFDKCLEAVRGFLPYVDNWATCDQLSPRALGRNLPRLQEEIQGWLASGQTYTVRFGVDMMMAWFLEDAFDARQLDWIASLRSQEYYVNMAVAWYVATALAKQYDAALTLLVQRRLAPWTHNRAIQKAIESRRLTQQQKDCLRALRLDPPAGRRKTRSE